MLPESGQIVEFQVNDLDVLLLYQGVNCSDLFFCYIRQFFCCTGLYHAITIHALTTLEHDQCVRNGMDIRFIPGLH